MRRFLYTLLLCTGLTGLAQGPVTRGLTVRIHIFSGRKDPEFRITDPAEIAKIQAMLQSNAAEDPKPETPEVLGHKLGYRGIVVIPDSGLPGFANLSAFALNHGRLQVHRHANGQAKATLHLDAAAALENYLLERGLAQGHLETKVVQRIHEQR